jgi:IPT/TIG domain
VTVGHRLSVWIIGATLVAAPLVVGPTVITAASPAPSHPHAAVSSHTKPFFTAASKPRPASTSHSLKHVQSQKVTLHAMGRATAALGGVGQTTRAHSAPAIATATDKLAAFSGASQGLDVSQHGNDQAVAPPDQGLATGPTDVVEAVNSTIDVFSRAGALLGSDDINAFVTVDPNHFVSDPRIIYDASSQRWWLTVTEVGNPFSCTNFASPVLLAVSASSNPLPFSSWLVYALPFSTSGTFLGDQPGLGISSNTLAVSWNDIDCHGNFLGADINILQKTDFEHNSGANADAPFVSPSAFGSQPVQSYGSTTTQYVVVNDSDCAPSVCTNPVIEVDGFTGTPEANNVAVHQSFLTMTPTAVDNTYFGLPPAQQSGTSTTLNTDDDRFLNAVWEGGMIWTAGGTECTPSGVPRSCLDYVGVTASSTGVVNPTVNQINNVGVSGSYLYYPSVSVDAAGNVFTVFVESSSSTFPTIMSATIPAGGSALSAFQTVHASTGFYNPPSGACMSIASTNACRWGDYSGAAQDPSNPNDVWVAAEAEDGSTPGCLSANQCWGTDVAQLTLAPPTITALTPASGPVAGGQTVTVTGRDFGTDTTATFGGSAIAISNLIPSSFTFVTPPSVPAGTTDLVQATDALGTTAALTYTYVGLANYVPLSPFRILDTRTGGGGAFGPGVIRAVQVTGIGATPVPITATAVVMNVTEVLGTANSLLTVYPYGTSRPNASNLNFAAGTVIPNLVTVTLGPGGKVNIYNAVGTVNVLADVEGYFTPQPAADFNGLFHPIAPVRVCDTRSGSPTPTCRAHGALGPGAVMAVNLSGGGIPSDGTAGAAVLNITGILGTAGTYLTVFPSDSNGGCTFSGSHPGSSTLNLSPRAVEANRVMVQLGPAATSGPTTSVCVYNAAGTINVILDANGWYGSVTATGSPAGFQYQALAPTRICDTRTTSAGCATGAIGAGTSLARLIGVAGSDGIPAVGNPTVVVAIIANLTAVTPTVATVLTLYPANLARPNASDLNLNAGEVLPNLAVVQLDTVAGLHNGDVYLFNSVGSVSAIIDIEGWFQ